MAWTPRYSTRQEADAACQEAQGRLNDARRAGDQRAISTWTKVFSERVYELRYHSDRVWAAEDAVAAVEDKYNVPRHRRR